MTPLQLQEAWAQEGLELSREEQLLLRDTDLHYYDRSSPSQRRILEKMFARAAAKALRRKREGGE